ncbi:MULTISPECIES: hypothetical protein [unclassified Pseudoalteromonas]|uniref:hypothetical protein n=1 Tax=unclassified Pseudoalteromonas TaxID=194690 RepID=UPI000466F41C|nr:MULTISPECIES: hypothetical protein [unclassified Pseudoalteromonas]
MNKSKVFAFFIGVNVVTVLTVAMFYLQQSSYEDKIEQLDKKIDFLSKQVAVTPKIVTLDLAKTAMQWAGRSDELAFKAVETSIQYYNENGYLVIDKASVIGDTGNYAGQVPTPEKMKEMLNKK